MPRSHLRLLALLALSGWLASFAPARADLDGGAGERVLRDAVSDAGSRRTAKRLAAWRRLVDLGPQAVSRRDEIEINATRAAERAYLAVQAGTTVDDLAELGTRREELDRLRANALELIRDTERYFYPSKTPDVSVERARLYPEVRREVERRVAAVRAIWQGRVGVDIPDGVRAAALELVWIERVAAAFSFDLTWPVGLPRWVLGMAETSERIDLGNFAWTAVQAGSWRHDRAVKEFNESRWQERRVGEGSPGGSPDGVVAPESPRPIECEQVRITNEYRRMMGECALAWSEALQRAAHDHSQYMATRSVLTHSTGLPGRETAAARMRSAGYRFGRAENIYFGPGGALAAHVLWLGSSAHHRALLDPDLRGMASAEVDGYWTQSLGTSTSFTADPEFIKALWHD